MIQKDLFVFSSLIAVLIFVLVALVAQSGLLPALLVALVSFAIVYGCTAQYLSQCLYRDLRSIEEALDKVASGNLSERLVLQRSDAIGNLAVKLNALAASMEAHDVARKQWIADTSHELRTPIAVLRAQVEAFQDGVQEVNPRTLSVLHKEIMALNHLVDDIHWLARFDIGLIVPNMVPTEVVSILQEVIEAAEGRFESKKITLDYTAIKNGQMFVVNADASRLRQVFNNLLENSFYYTETDGKLTIDLTACDEYGAPTVGDGKPAGLIIRFDDSEPGVPVELLPRIFDRFFRVDQSRSRTLGGSGLGLSICKKIVESHGGIIQALPSPLGGVRMEMRLPIAPGASRGGEVR